MTAVLFMTDATRHVVVHVVNDERWWQGWTELVAAIIGAMVGGSFTLLAARHSFKRERQARAIDLFEQTCRVLAAEGDELALLFRTRSQLLFASVPRFRIFLSKCADASAQACGVDRGFMSVLDELYHDLTNRFDPRITSVTTLEDEHLTATADAIQAIAILARARVQGRYDVYRGPRKADELLESASRVFEGGQR